MITIRFAQCIVFLTRCFKSIRFLFPGCPAASPGQVPLLPCHLRLQGSGLGRDLVQRRRRHRQLRRRRRGLDDRNRSSHGRVRHVACQLCGSRWSVKQQFVWKKWKNIYSFGFVKERIQKHLFVWTFDRIKQTNSFGFVKTQYVWN